MSEHVVVNTEGRLLFLKIHNNCYLVTTP